MTRETADANVAHRQSKLTPELHDRIINAVRAGNYIQIAAEYAGVHRDTLYTWLKKGRAATRGAYHEFALALDNAVAQSEVRDLALIGKAAEEQWQAAAWRLERRYPDRYGRKTRVEGTLGIQPLPMVDPEKLTLDEARQLRWLLDKARPEVIELPAAEHGPLELVAGTSDSNGTG